MCDAVIATYKYQVLVLLFLFNDIDKYSWQKRGRYNKLKFDKVWPLNFTKLCPEDNSFYTGEMCLEVSFLKDKFQVYWNQNLSRLSQQLHNGVAET